MMTTTTGLVAVADLPCLLRRDPDHVRRLIHHGLLPTMTIDGATYVRRAEVAPLIPTTDEARRP